MKAILPSPDHNYLGEKLVEAKVITAQQLRQAQQLQEQSDKRIDQILVELDLVSVEEVARLRSGQLNIPLVDLRKCQVQSEALRLIRESTAREYNVLPLEVTAGGLKVAMAEPEDIQAVENLSAQARMRIEPVLATADDIQEAIEVNYRLCAEIERQISQLTIQEVSAVITEHRLLADELAEKPLPRAVNLLLQQAVRDRASDIHLTPQEDRVRVRFRIDGILHDMMSLPVSIHEALMSRIKILAGMNIAERRRPQDGHLSIMVADRNIDIRVASTDTIYGEMVVLRVLDKSRALFTLSQLGLMADSLARYRQMLGSPYGMILIAGPTGSGKTTTLYASIDELDREQRNIMTIEDPVEYHFKDINSIQVNARAGVTFASGLRAILRLDPDVILVGEIRDADTAKTAVQAAITGHLVLSSIHANDAVGALSRLRDLGVEPFFVSTAVIGVASQRMVRRICPHCRALVEAPMEEGLAYQRELGEKQSHFYYGTGCNFCANTGYLGRTGVFEFLSLNEPIRRLLVAGASEKDIRAEAIKAGMVPMSHDGMRSVKQGITTPCEVIRNVFTIDEFKM